MFITERWAIFQLRPGRCAFDGQHGSGVYQERLSYSSASCFYLEQSSPLPKRRLAGDLLQPIVLHPLSHPHREPVFRAARIEAAIRITRLRDSS